MEWLDFIKKIKTLFIASKVKILWYALDHRQIDTISFEINTELSCIGFIYVLESTFNISILQDLIVWPSSSFI